MSERLWSRHQASAVPSPPPWQATTSYLRAAAVGAALGLAAVVLRRPDLLVLATPLLAVSVWSALTKPSGSVSHRVTLGHRRLREGEATVLRATLHRTEGMEQAVVVVAAGPWVLLRPASGIVCSSVGGAQQSDGAAQRDGAAQTLDIAVQSLRWGTRQVGPTLVGGTSAWGAYRWGPVHTYPLGLTTLPLPATFDASAPMPHPRGLVGVHRSVHPGDGNEFAGIRPFHAGDRLRRVHWPVSLRTGDLHVTQTWADQDSQVVLLVDAMSDIGVSAGLRGQASSLDVTVRAAGALAEHYLRTGDRVGLRVLGTDQVLRTPAAAGRNHLRRVLDTLAAVEVTSEHRPDATRVQLGLSAGVLVVMLSPLTSPRALEQAVALARRRLTVVVIDTLPPDVQISGQQPYAELAWRIRRLEREREIRRVERAGVAVVPWRGPGSLDQVLRDIARRSVAPRIAAR